MTPRSVCATVITIRRVERKFKKYTKLRSLNSKLSRDSLFKSNFCLNGCTWVGLNFHGRDPESIATIRWKILMERPKRPPLIFWEDNFSSFCVFISFSTYLSVCVSVSRFVCLFMCLLLCVWTILQNIIFSISLYEVKRNLINFAFIIPPPFCPKKM